MIFPNETTLIASAAVIVAFALARLSYNFGHIVALALAFYAYRLLEANGSSAGDINLLTVAIMISLTLSELRNERPRTARLLGAAGGSILLGIFLAYLTAPITSSWNMGFHEMTQSALLLAPPLYWLFVLRKKR